MIVPWLLGFRDFVLAPITWTLVALNLAFFVMTQDVKDNGKIAANDTFFEVRNIERTGIYYLQYQGVLNTPPASELVLWGGKAMRDPGFRKDFEVFEFQADAAELKSWRREFRQFLDQSARRPIHIFGVSRDPAEARRFPMSWITYQFMHASFLHLFSNLIFLVLFGIAIERRLGSNPVWVVYLLGGIFGVWFALAVDEPAAVPMVGASASVSAMIGYYMWAEPRKNIRFFYFFTPFEGFFGEVYLSKWWIFPLLIAPDVATWLSDASSESARILGQTVATSAHVGGAFFGMALAIVLSFAQSRHRRPANT